MRKENTASRLSASTESILESISDGVFTVDGEWRITSFNRAAERITGIPRKDAIGQRCCEVFRSSMCAADACALKRTLKTGKPIIGRSGYIINAKGERIPISVSTAVLQDQNGNVIGGAETFRDLSDIEALRKELQDKAPGSEMLSRNPAMQRIFSSLSAISASPSTVLILGETGTGKEVLARAIHHASAHSTGPFVAINCGALPDSLLESELFGYKVGAFTGADRDKPGRFALARGGTLFLDEIGEISPAMQVRLLRVLQEHTFEPLGSHKTEKTDCRVIAATHRDLKSLVKSGAFREDLYYRIHVVQIKLPPLRERKEDIVHLAQHFVERFNRLQERKVPGLSPEALSLLLAHDWPGNIRELENAIERAFIVCGRSAIQIGHLPEELTAGRCIGTHALADTTRKAHDLLSEEHIRQALARNRNNRQAAADELGIHKTTLFRRIKKLKIELPEQDGRACRELKQ